MTQTVVETPKIAKRRLPRLQELGLVVVIALLVVGLTIATSGKSSRYGNPFFNIDNLVDGVSRQMSVYAIMAVGMTCVIITGGIDISVGWMFGFTALAGASALERLPVNAPWYLVLPVAFFVPVLVGALWGTLNGSLVVLLRLHPFIVTLATMSILGGLINLVFPSTVPNQGRDLPDAFVHVMNYQFGTSVHWVPAIIMVVVMICGAIFLQMLVAGRETYAVGGNAEAARFSGIRVWWATLRVYIIMGICCGIAAIVHLGRWKSTSTDDGQGYELLVIASAVVGGASLTGGRGTALGALLGTLVITLIDNGINTLQWSTQYTKVIVGIAILVAVSIDRLSDYLARRRGALG
jgi:ribose/xylose/arabinose/galactoside ABC-type transport system permease subunit